MTKVNTITFTISSNIFGFGHLKRMINFKYYLNKNNFSNSIYSYSNDYFRNKKTNQKIKINNLKYLIIKKKIKLIILDLSNNIFSKKKIFSAFMKVIYDLSLPVLVFDEFTNSIFKNYRKFKKYLFVFPYIYPHSLIKKENSKTFLIGPKFFVVKKIKKKNYKNFKLKKILITCGGSDFKNLSLKIFSILKKYKHFKIGIVIGPNFKKSLVKKIRLLKNNNLTIYQNLPSINFLALNYDLVISTSGLTKYELLITNMNFAVICENKKFYNYHKNFSNQKLNYELGYYKNSKLLDDKINNLVKNYKKFFKNKKKLKSIDSNGANRIIKKLKQKYFKNL